MHRTELAAPRLISAQRGAAPGSIGAHTYDAVRPARSFATEDTPVRVLIIPGLHNSGSAHWQTWLQAQYRDAVRVEQGDWHAADLERWSQRIRRTVRSHPPARWIAVAHSFGCLALAHALKHDGAGIARALLVAPADPKKFGVTANLPMQPLDVHCHLIGSQSDPWMRPERAIAWALLWGARYIDLGDAGHINTEAGFGPLPLAKSLVDQMLTQVRTTRRAEPARPAAWSAYSFAV